MADRHRGRERADRFKMLREQQGLKVYLQMTNSIARDFRGPLTAVAAMGVLIAGGLRVQAGDDVEYVVINARRVITVCGEEFAPGRIVIEDGKISLVGGSKIEYPPSAKVIDARQETVLPGFIHPRTRHGLATYKRSGVHGDQTAASEVYLTQIDFSELMEAGFTAVCYVPDGSGISGIAAAYRTAGPEDARKLKDYAYLFAPIDWTAKEKDTLRGAFKKAKEEIEKVEKARKEWEEKQKKKKAEQEKSEKDEAEKPEDEKKDGKDDVTDAAKPPPQEVPDAVKAEKKDEDEFKPPDIDPKHKPIVDLIQKKEGAILLVELERAADLHHLDDVFKPYEEIAHQIYLKTSRSTDYHHIADELGERKARVALRPWIHYLPQTTSRFNLVTALVNAGAEVSVLPSADTREEYLGVRERLADLVRAGLSRETAIKTLTLHPARLIGVEKQLGSIEKGKDADLIFMDGDPLDSFSKVTRMIILGNVVWQAEKS